MLTPLEIEKHKFKKELFGYSAGEVDEFNEMVAENYEKIYKENIALKDKINLLTNAVKQYKSMEETLQNAIIVAQSTGEEVQKNAREKAGNIIREAENQASRILNDAGKEVTKVSYEYEKMKRNVEVFRTKIISLLTSQLDIVKEFAMPEEESAKERQPEAEEKPVCREIPETGGESVEATLKKLERVTQELPKLVLNEKGEYVPAEGGKPSAADNKEDKAVLSPAASSNKNDDYDEELGF